MAKKYKQLSFSTTLRNPMRMKEFLFLIGDKKFKNKILTIDLTKLIMMEAVKRGIYNPTFLQGQYSDNDLRVLFKENAPTHKETGYPPGWASRFYTYFHLLRDFGLIWIKLDAKILITQKGKSVINGDKSIEYVITDSLLKYSSSKFRPGSLNDQNIILNLFNVIKEYSFITGDQLFAISCAKNNLFDDFKSIVDNPSKINIEKYWGSEFPKNKYEKRRETIDDIVRKIRVTNIFNIKKENNTYLISIKKTYAKKTLKEMNIVDLSTLSEEEYFKEISSVKNNLTFFNSVKPKESNSFFQFWDKKLSMEDCIKMMESGKKKNYKSHIEELQLVDRYIIFEFACTMLLWKRWHKEIKKITLNLNYDDNFIPTSPAGAGKPDSQMKLNNGDIINLEMTTLTKTSQHFAETSSTLRHMKHEKAKYVIFLAPEISYDLCYFYNMENLYKNNNLIAVSIKKILHNKSTLKEFVITYKELFRSKNTESVYDEINYI